LVLHARILSPHKIRGVTLYAETLKEKHILILLNSNNPLFLNCNQKGVP
jgi:hypothetical protein